MKSLMIQTINFADLNNIEYILDKHVTIHFFFFFFFGVGEGGGGARFAWET